MEKYLQLAKLINRQAGEGAELFIQGLYEAKKTFRCESTDPYQTGFKVARGEYFLLVNGKDYDATRSRLHRACRTQEEQHTAWPRIGIPVTDGVQAYADEEDSEDYEDFLVMQAKAMKEEDGNSSDDIEQNTDDAAKAKDENDYIKQLAVEIPGFEDEVLPPEMVTDNYIMTYELREPSDALPEEVFCISEVTADDFAGNEELQKLFHELIRCESKKMISKIKREKTR